MTTAKLKLSIDETGRGTAFLNDLDIGGFTQSIEFSATTNELTKVKITIMAAVDAEIMVNLEEIALAKNYPPEPEGVRLLDGTILKTRRRGV